MPVKPCSFAIDHINNRELESRGTPMFPCGWYLTTTGAKELIKNIPWHWHEEVEILAVCSGTLVLELIGKQYQIKKGEGAFINSSILHSATSIDSSNCEIKSFVFDPNIISGAMESIFEHRYVKPLLDCFALPAVYLDSKDWCCDAVQCILDAFDAFQKEDFGYEFLIREKLSHLWLAIIKNNQDLLLEGKTARSLDAIRLKDMLSYIHANYDTQIELSDIARAASISKRECLRCFKKTIGVTPIQYLLKHRISISSGLLINTSLNITQICQKTGFDSPSYFSLIFKKMIGTTPKEYRKQLSTKPVL